MAPMSKQHGKIIVIVGDGMGDHPHERLGGRTLLQAADIPNMRRIAGCGETALVKTVPAGMAPGSDVANLSLMGIDPGKHYTGRAPIEAAGAGLSMGESDVAFRCNLITVENGLIADHSSDHISTGEARPLIEALAAGLGREGLSFHVGSGYRHIILWENGPWRIEATPPHDVLGQSFERHLPRGEGAGEVMALIEASHEILDAHPVNEARRKAGKRPATHAWLWGQGRRVSLPGYKDMFGLSGGVISAVDLIRGLGRLCGLDAVNVPGATGFLDTNYAGKVEAALGVLRQKDYVFLHVEAPDECGHVGDLDLKLRAINEFDLRIVGPLWRGLDAMGAPYRLFICTDHCTPVAVRNHTSDPVPIAVMDGPRRCAGEAAFDESVNGGEVWGYAFEWIARRLRQAGRR